MKLSSKNPVSSGLIIGAAILLGIFVGLTYHQYSGSGNFGFLDLGSTNKVDRILNLVRKKYVDSVNVDSFENLAVDEILKSLDPHSVYLPPVKAQNQNETLEGNFDGIGIEYYLLNDTLFVSHVRPEGPSAKAGLQKGDKIIAVNGEKMVRKPLVSENLIGRLRGKKGSTVLVSIIRNGEKNPKTLEIVRDRIVVSSIDVAYLMDGSTGFIKISNFGADTDEDFAEALQKLEVKGMKNLILDLRGNGGGYLSAATALADQFLTDGRLIVYTKGLHDPRTDYYATKDGLFEMGKLAVLIDEGTASASEIFAGAIQDLDRGIIIGRRSFGKGLVQEQFGFSDGSAMNLTVARYYTPSGRSIQKPYDKGLKEYRDELNKRYEKGEYTSLDSTLGDSALFNKKFRFKTASGKNVYGGGGIMPDIFVPLDTTYFTPSYYQINAKSLIPDFIYGKLINRINLSDFKDADAFVRQFFVSDALFSDFISYCKLEKTKITDKDMDLSRPAIVTQMKSILSRYYFGEEGFYKIMNQQDDSVLKALLNIKNQEAGNSRTSLKN